MADSQASVAQHRDWIEQAIDGHVLKREEKWSEVVAVGDGGFFERIQQQLGKQYGSRKIREVDDAYVLREPDTAYHAHFEAKKGCLSTGNEVLFNENA